MSKSVPQTLTGVFLDRVSSTPDLAALVSNENGVWEKMTFAEYGRRARQVAQGLVGVGVSKGDRVALLSSNRPEWNITDVAILLGGGVTVPIYSTSSVEQVVHVLDHSEASVAVVDTAEQLSKIQEGRPKLPHLRKIVAMDPNGQGEDVISLEGLVAAGEKGGGSLSKELDERTASIKPDDLATIVYTSGTTGAPKGAMLSHAGFTWALRVSGGVLQLKPSGDRVLSYLPLSHIFERLNSGWGGIQFGMEVWFAQSLEKLLPNLQECRPTFFIGVPRVYEKFHQGLKEKIADNPKRELIEKAIGLGLKQGSARLAGSDLSLADRLKHRLLDKLVLSKLRERLGMQDLRVAVTGGAPIEPEIMTFIRAIGIDLVEGYGQTETNAPTAITPPGNPRPGAVGPPVPGLEMKFDHDGEVLVRGPNVFMGYYKDEQATREVMTEDGFLRTGDVGELDEAGYLKITDRKKDLIKTAGGKYIAPQMIEGKLKLAPLIGQAVVIGDRRPYPSALLTLDPEYAQKWASAKGLNVQDVTDLVTDESLLSEIGRIVDEVNEGLSQAEKIKRWTLLPRDFTQEDDEITPTLKVRRKLIGEKYSAEIEQMYQPV